MKKIYLTLLIMTIYMTSHGQSKPLLGQYFQNLPAFAPSLTGANDFLDLRLAFRQQWVGFEGAPRTVSLSGYTPLKSKENNYRYRSLRLGADESDESKLKLKHGIGAYLQSDEQDLFRQFEFNINYAIHVPVFERTYLSFGVSAGIANEKIDIYDVTVKNSMDDQTYQSLLNDGNANSYFNLTGGLSLHSDRYYLSFSTLPLIRTFISGNDNVNNDQNYLRHQILAGARFYLSQHAELIPNGFVRLDQTMPVLFDVGVRFRYQGKYWAGASYRNDDTIIGMLGLTVDDMWNFSYSYEYGTSDFNTFNNGTHEIVLGVQLFNFKRFTSMW